MTEILQNNNEVGKNDEFHFSGDIQADSIGYNEAPPLMDDFHQRLISIDEEMGADELETLKFLCRDHIAVSKLEKAEMPIDIFEYMKKALMIDDNNVDFLLECLGRLHRFDLVKKLGYDVDAVRENFSQLQGIYPFRMMLVDLADDVDDKDVDKIRFLLKSWIKKKVLNQRQSLLQLFVCMEQEGLLSPTRVHILQSLMESIRRPELVERVRQFKGEPPRIPQPPKLARTPSGSSQSLRDLDRELAAQNIAPPPYQLGTEFGMEPGLPVRSGDPGIYPKHGGSAADLNARLQERTPSAGTLTCSSSEGEPVTEQRKFTAIPEAIFLQICEDLKIHFDDLGDELRFSLAELQDLTARYDNPAVRTRRLLETWHARMSNKRQIPSMLHQVLVKLDCKTTAESLNTWIQGGAGQPSEFALGEPQDENIAMSMREAQPRLLLQNPSPQLVPTGAPFAVPEVTDLTQQLQQLGMGNLLPVPGGQYTQPNIATNSPQVVYMQAPSTGGQGQMMNQGHPAAMNLTPVSAMSQQQAVAMAAGQNVNGYQGNHGVNVTGMLPGIQGQAMVATGNRGQPLTDTGHLDMPIYKMTSKPIGWCVIINNREFHVEGTDGTQMPERKGTDKDAESLQHTFEKFGFIVRRYDNLKDTEMMQRLVDAAHNVNHSKFDCFVCCILTHGVLNHLYGANGHLISIRDLTSTFQSNRCPSLAGKPKLFFLQACQGRDKMGGGEIERDAGEIPETDTLPKDTIPNEADFLLGYATVPGYVSFRSRNHGSWYIRKLCELLEKHAERQDLLSILTEVNNQVSKADANMSDGTYKQVPAPLFTLRKKLFLRKSTVPDN